MTYLLRLVACLFLCVSLNSFGALLGGGSKNFASVQPFAYWLSEGYAPSTSRAWSFVFTEGYQDHDDSRTSGDSRISDDSRTSDYSWSWSWAVRNGDVSAVPLPAGI